MTCHCRSDRRSLALLAPELTERYADLADFGGKLGWEVHRGLEGGYEAVVAGLGSSQAVGTVSELVNTLRAIVGETRLAGLRASWVTGCCGDLSGRPDLLKDAVPLIEMAPADSSPLLGMLNEQRIETWYQPIFRAESLELWGFECLMRGRDVDGRVVYPNQLLEWAAQENLTFMLDRVCRETHLTNAGRDLAGLGCRILLNFLPTAIYQPEFCLRTTMAAARAAGVDPGRVIFEVVETEKVGDHEHLRKILDYYRRKGFAVALDDVGSGYSGLTMLADLSPDLIKLDRGLIVKAAESNLHRHVCFLLVSFARETGKLILAEGVETEEQRRVVEALGVDLVQGYLYGRPGAVPATEAAVALAGV